MTDEVESSGPILICQPGECERANKLREAIADVLPVIVGLTTAYKERFSPNTMLAEDAELAIKQLRQTLKDSQ